MRIRSPLVLALLVLGVLLLGRVLLLGPGEGRPELDPASRGLVQRILLSHPEGTASGPRDVEVVKVWTPAEDGIEDWNIRARESEVTTRRMPAGLIEGLWMRDGERMEIILPIPAEVPSFNQVALRLFGRGDKKDVTVRVRGRGFQLASPARRFPGNEMQNVVLDLGGVRQFDGKIEELRISLSAQNALGDVALEAISLWHKPVTSWLPTPEEPGMVDIQFDSRRSVGIASSAGLEARFTVPERAELSFACAQPEALQRPGEDARLVMELVDADGATVRSKELGIEPGKAWREHTEDLSELAGSELGLRFRLAAKGEGESVAALSVPIVSSGGQKAPSVLIITSDTHRRDYIGYAQSGVEVDTPFLDGLAARGVHFTDCYATTNITNPSHVALMTATDPRDTGVVDNISPLAAAAPTLAEAFADAGYLTFASVSANHLSDDQSGLGQGFDRMAAPADPQRDSVPTIEILEEWMELAEGRPLFAWLHIFDAHSPYLPPPDYRRMYYPGGQDPLDPDLPEPPAKAAPPWLKQVRDLDYVVALYKGEVTYLDEQLEDFLVGSRFEQGPLLLTSDHGESMTAHKIWFEHKGLFPNTLGVPLLVVGEGVPAGVRVEHPVLQTDSARTLLDLAGVEGREIPGVNLLEQLEESRVDARFALSSHGNDAAVQLGDWFLALHLSRPGPAFYDTPKRRHQAQLFNLVEDPRCLRDLAEVEPSRTRRMRELLVEWLTSARESGWNEGSAVIDSAEAAALEGLGYADEARDSTDNDWIDPECECEMCEHYREE